MAEETQNLVQDEMPPESVTTFANIEPRRMSCSRGGIVPALSIFVALLLAGQAVSVYFITQQQGKINELDTTTKQLRLNEMIRKLPGTPPSQKRPKPMMAMSSIALAVDDDGTQQKLLEAAMTSNRMEDAAHYMLLQGNPMRTFPSFNGTILTNLRKLKRTMTFEQWMQFEAWMQNWYLFYLVQNSKAPETPPPPNVETVTGPREPLEGDFLLPVEFGRSGNLVYASTSYSTDSMPRPIDEIPSGAPVLTDCQMRNQIHHLPGAFKPQCDDDGNYKSKQCWRSTGFCWCVYKNGTEVQRTRTRAPLDCSSSKVPDMVETDY
ncbi:HLA class II histocompatibility antigen gamma chain isoform X1 [Engystomops pustulosus]|uniref:HLA class II histocompatibility antigen gamma chain isoform X1 n=1 Tax=Engystomops pustulosus TaxID=76066 RepID=UPI003AFB07AA